MKKVDESLINNISGLCDESKVGVKKLIEGLGHEIVNERREPKVGEVWFWDYGRRAALMVSRRNKLFIVVDLKSNQDVCDDSCASWAKALGAVFGFSSLDEYYADKLNKGEPPPF